MGGELFDMVIERKYFTEADAASITAAILSVMQHCHSKGIIHRGAQRFCIARGACHRLLWRGTKPHAVAGARC